MPETPPSADRLETEPGYREIGFVQRCDSSTCGGYVHPLDVSDVVSGWTELYALKNRFETSVVSGVVLPGRLRLQGPASGAMAPVQ